MEHNLSVKGNSLSQSLKLQGKSKQENRSLSYADLHHEITTNVKEFSSNASKSNEKERLAGKLLKEEEIIKYMSNLPTYLERGNNFLDKGLNVGVLDWERLERWQCGQKQIPCMSSSSSCNRSSAFSTNESSLPSSKAHSSPIRQRVHRPLLHPHLNASSVRDTFPGGPDVKNQELKPLQSDTFNVKQNFIRTDQSSCKYNHYIELERLKRHCLEQKVVREKMKKTGEFTKIDDKQQKPELHNIKTVPETVCFRNRGVPKINLAEVHVFKDSGTSLTEAGQKDIMARCSLTGTTELNATELNSEIPRPCQRPREDNKKNIWVIPQSFVGVKGTDPSSETSNSVKQTANRGVSPSKIRILYGTNSNGAHTDSRKNNSSNELDLAKSKVPVEKARSFSPFSRLSIGLSKKSKGSSSIDGSGIPHQSSARISEKSKAVNANSSANLDASSNDKRRSSPLRRLLDPILKPKTGNYLHARPLERDSIEKTGKKTSNVMSESSTIHPVKVKLDMSRCRKIDVNHAVQDKKGGTPAGQALLQAAVKNGLPLLTFAVDNVSDVLAATMKSTSLGKEKSRIYTFFTIQEVKKKNGSWINQEGKGKGSDYISNVVAQMKVSEPHFSNLTRKEEFCEREFVLVSVNPRRSDQQNSDFQSNNEIAAIVIKIPVNISIRNGLQLDAINDPAKTDSNSLFTGAKSFSISRANVGSSPAREAIINTTVILPSGNHSLPSKGGPSSLIERWNSGGACDCGGWDLGCKLRILASSKQYTKKLSSSQHHSQIDQLVLVTQEGEVDDDQPILSMNMLKEKIFSIEFGSSLSHIQAFSISIALLDSRNLCEFGLEEKTLDESGSTKHGKLMTSNRVAKVSAEYLPNPPLSPFGRV